MSATITVVCDSPRHARGKTATVAHYTGDGERWCIEVPNRRRGLGSSVDSQPATVMATLWPPMPDGSPSPVPVVIWPLPECKLCRRRLPISALKPLIMLPLLDRLASSGVCTVTLRQLEPLVFEARGG